MSQKLFDYMLKQHDVILLDTDMHEIKLICNKELIESLQKFCRDENPEAGFYDQGYNQALENMLDLINKLKQ